MKLASLLLLPILVLIATPGCAREGHAAAVATLSLNGTTMCTGVAIKPQVVLTATHCLYPGLLADGLPILEVLASDGNDHTLIRTQKVYEQVVKVDKHAKQGESPEVGTNLELYGHPNGLPLQYRRGYVTGYVPTPPFAQEVVAAPEVLLLDLEGTGGDSGGPMLDKRGKLVGTVSIVLTTPGFRLMGSFPYSFTPDQWELE